MKDSLPFCTCSFNTSDGAGRAITSAPVTISVCFNLEVLQDNYCSITVDEAVNPQH